MLNTSCKKENEPIATESTKETINWMQDLIAKFPNKTITLKKISMPRAHDAGMYEVNNCWAGNACNTKTQHKNTIQKHERNARSRNSSF